MTVSLGVILGWLLLTTVVGILAGARRVFSMEEYFVGGRSFGLVLFYTTAAAEIYSSFAFLGLAGWAYSRGISIIYALAYGSIAYALYFFLGPRINRLGRSMRYVTQPDFFEDRYGSNNLGLLVALVGVVSILPYLQLQIMGAGIIVQIASGGAVGWRTAVVASFLAAIVFVYISGMRGVAWTNFLQAIIMLVGMVSAGVLVSYAFFGGVGTAFRTLVEVTPTHLVLPDTSGNGVFWYASTALLSAFGFWMWPHIFMATYSAKSERIVRLNSTVLPLYQLAMLPVVIVGFTCAAQARVDPTFARDITQPDQVMLVALVKTMPGWVVGLIGAGGLAASMSTSSALILGAANLTARNILQKRLMPDMTDLQAAKAARLLVPAFGTVAVALAFIAPAMLVNLLIIGYSGITQFFPGIILGLFSRRSTGPGVTAGLLTGVAIVLVFFLTGVRPPLGLQPGFIALACNFAVVTAVSRLTRPIEQERLKRFDRCLGPG